MRHLLGIFKNLFRDNDEFGDIGLRQFCKAEYKKEWQFAYRCYQIDGKFPSKGRGIV
tara:strand:+ start:897 stop:1067 length:171 start_codon:yes stop_codon:yes gene_type:complete